LNQLAIDRQTKIDNIACWHKQLNAEAAAIDNEIKTLAGRMKSKINKAESLKHYLSDILGGAKFESARNKITWRASDEVAVFDEKLLSDEYKKTVTEIKISKADIKAAIKSGTVVIGAALIHKNNIQIK
jgi:alanine dehydrogenase